MFRVEMIGRHVGSVGVADILYDICHAFSYPIC